MTVYCPPGISLFDKIFAKNSFNVQLVNLTITYTYFEFHIYRNLIFNQGLPMLRKNEFLAHEDQFRGVVPGGAAPDFGRSVNPISTRGDRLCPPNY